MECVSLIKATSLSLIGPIQQRPFEDESNDSILLTDVISNHLLAGQFNLENDFLLQPSVAFELPKDVAGFIHWVATT